MNKHDFLNICILDAKKPIKFIPILISKHVHFFTVAMLHKILSRVNLFKISKVSLEFGCEMQQIELKFQYYAPNKTSRLQINVWELNWKRCVSCCQ